MSSFSIRKIFLYFEKSLPNILNNIIELIKANPIRQETISKLAKRGWFIAGNLADMDSINTFLDGIKIDIENLNEDTIDIKTSTFIAEFFYKTANEIIANNAARKDILIDAITAHNQSIYNLSVPVFLIQADGICKDITGCNLFHNFKFENFKQYTPKNVYKFATGLDFLACYYSFQEDPKKESMTFYSKTERDKILNFTTLNRHEVLHGEVTNYGTKINSLKAFSLLCSIDSLLRENDVKALLNDT